MLTLKIQYDNGENRHITDNLNMEQFRALVKHVESGEGAFAHFTKIEIIKK
jgi:hypothetical protein